MDGHLQPTIDTTTGWGEGAAGGQDLERERTYWLLKEIMPILKTMIEDARDPEADQKEAL